MSEVAIFHQPRANGFAVQKCQRLGDYAPLLNRRRAARKDAARMPSGLDILGLRFEVPIGRTGQDDA